MKYHIPSEASLKRLYIGKQMSSADIGKLLQYSEHKINYWIRKYDIPKRTISDAMYQKRNPDGDPFKIKQIANMQDAKLFGLGLGLYWGEGNKRSKNSVRLGNTDPHLIQVFMEFLIRLCDVKPGKMKFALQIFSDMSSKKVLGFWLNNLKKFGIIKEQFSKITVTPARSIGTYREKSQYGVLSVYVHNSKLKKVIDQHIADVAQW